MPLDVNNRKTLTDLVFKEPLSESTMKIRKNLIFSSVISILLTVYELKITKTPWLNIEVPKGTPDILHGVVSVALIYFFVLFMFYVWEDLRRWFLAGEMLHTHSYFDLTLAGRNHLNTIDQTLEQINPLPEPDERNQQYRRVKSNLEQADIFFSEVNGKVNTVYEDHRALGVIQWSRLILIDLGVPVSLAIIALNKISSAFFPFIAAVFK